MRYQKYVHYVPRQYDQLPLVFLKNQAIIGNYAIKLVSAAERCWHLRAFVNDFNFYIHI